MQRNLLKTLPIYNEYASLYENSICLQSIRWRKRRWAPVSASKKYFVREKPEVVPEEAAELRMRYPKYKTSLKALTKYFVEQVKSQETAEVDHSRHIYQKLENEKILAINDEWNRETALIREARTKQAEEVINEERMTMVLKMEEEEQAQKEMAAQMVLHEQGEAKNFITEETLEQELEKALDGRFNYNFAIDLKGNQYIEMSDGQLQTKDPEHTLAKQVENV